MRMKQWIEWEGARVGTWKELGTNQGRNLSEVLSKNEIEETMGIEYEVTEEVTAKDLRRNCEGI